MKLGNSGFALAAGAAVGAAVGAVTAAGLTACAAVVGGALVGAAAGGLVGWATGAGVEPGVGAGALHAPKSCTAAPNNAPPPMPLRSVRRVIARPNRPDSVMFMFASPGFQPDYDGR